MGSAGWPLANAPVAAVRRKLHFADDTRHMIIFDVLSNDSPVGWKGERTRLYLTQAGYEKALDNQDKGHIKIISHAKVSRGNLFYDQKDVVR